MQDLLEGKIKPDDQQEEALWAARLKLKDYNVHLTGVWNKKVAPIRSWSISDGSCNCAQPFKGLLACVCCVSAKQTPVPSGIAAGKMEDVAQALAQQAKTSSEAAQSAIQAFAVQLNLPGGAKWIVHAFRMRHILTCAQN